VRLKNLSVDEMTERHYGHSSLKQFIHKVGLFILDTKFWQHVHQLVTVSNSMSTVKRVLKILLARK
jgi:hypothetical protein